MITKSNSQSGQDRFVDLILEGKRDGVFLDIGANHPIELSNTYALESELGWQGMLVDRDEHCIELCKQHRTSSMLKADAIEVNWGYIYGFTLEWAQSLDKPIDYLSLDCDENTRPILKNLLEMIVPRRFRVMTVETDLYRFGPGPRDAIHALLEKHGYDILCQNVRSSEGLIYESWAVDPKLVNMKVAEKFRSNHLKWSEILARA